MVCLPALIEIRIFLAFVRKRPHAEHAVLRLQHHVHAGGNVVGHERRDADAEVHVEAVAQLARGAFGEIFARPGHQAAPLLRTVRCSMRFW